MALVRPIMTGFRTLENTRPIFIANLLTAVLSVIMASYLVGGYEVNGVMFGMLLVQSVAFLCFLVLFLL